MSTPNERGQRGGAAWGLLLLVVVIAVVAAVVLSGRGEQGNASKQSGAPEKGEQTRGSDPAPAGSEKPLPPESQLKMPDGSKVAALNGAKNPQPAQWKRAYSPIVGKKIRNWPPYGDIEWYVHEDGTLTTTYVGEAIRFGKKVMEPVTYVEHPQSEQDRTPPDTADPENPRGKASKTPPAKK